MEMTTTPSDIEFRALLRKFMQMKPTPQTAVTFLSEALELIMLRLFALEQEVKQLKEQKTKHENVTRHRPVRK